MREDCCHYQSRTYDDGEVARFCTKDLAPEAPWRCPDPCSGYEHLVLFSSDLESGSLGRAPKVEDEPDVPTDDIVDVLADAEAIVNNAAPAVIAELDHERAPAKPWWRRKKGRAGNDDFGLSSR